jgi:hypothetical protein
MPHPQPMPMPMPIAGTGFQMPFASMGMGHGAPAGLLPGHPLPGLIPLPASTAAPPAPAVAGPGVAMQGLTWGGPAAARYMVQVRKPAGPASTCLAGCGATGRAAVNQSLAQHCCTRQPGSTRATVQRTVSELPSGPCLSGVRPHALHIAPGSLLGPLLVLATGAGLGKPRVPSSAQSRPEGQAEGGPGCPLVHSQDPSPKRKHRVNANALVSVPLRRICPPGSACSWTRASMSASTPQTSPQATWRPGSRRSRRSVPCCRAEPNL